MVATRDHHIDPGAHFSATPDFVDELAGTLRGRLRRRGSCIRGWTGRRIEAVFDKGEHAAAYSGFQAAPGPDGVPLADWPRAAGVDAVEVMGIGHGTTAWGDRAGDARRRGFAVTVG